MMRSALGETRTGAPPQQASRRIVVMGVSAVGKSTVSAALAEHLALGWLDADALHPVTNTDKITAGQPLTDDDRWPWLQAVAHQLAATAAADGLVVACSALRREYRDHLRAGAPGTVFIHLTGPRAVLFERADSRVGHFMPAALLESQLALLEPLEVDEQGTTLAVDAPVLDVVRAAASWVVSYE